MVLYSLATNRKCMCYTWIHFWNCNWNSFFFEAGRLQIYMEKCNRLKIKREKKIMLFYYALNTSEWTSKFSSSFAFKMQPKTLEICWSGDQTLCGPLSLPLCCRLHFVCVFVFFLHFFLSFIDVRAHRTPHTHTNTVALQSINEWRRNCIRRMAIWIVRLIFNATTKCFVAIPSPRFRCSMFIVDKLQVQITSKREPNASPRARTKFRLMFPFCILPQKS